MALCRTFLPAALLALSSGVPAQPPSDSGALDGSFGSGGKVQMRAFATGISGATSFTVNDLAPQADGKIVLVGGYADGGNDAGWVITRLNADGSLDTAFQGGTGTFSQPGYYFPFFSSNTAALARGVAVRADGHIVVGGTASIGGVLTATVIQLNADGTPDQSWGNNGQVTFVPASGDQTAFNAIVIDTVDPYAAGNVYAVGQYAGHDGSVAANHFFYAGISADGKTKVSNTFDASDGDNVSESATSVAVQPGTGNVIVGGYSAFASGSTRCSAISTILLPSPTFAQAHLYTAWGTGGAISFTVNGAPFPNDVCNAVTMNGDGSMLIGGYGTASTTGGTYQAAVLALYDNQGVLQQHYSSGIGYPDLYAFDYTGGALVVNDINAIAVLRAEPYDGKLIAAGFNDDPHLAPISGDDFAIVRLDAPVYINFSNDDTFHGGNSVLIDWGSRHVGSSGFTSNDRVLAARFDSHGQLVVAGYAGDAAGGSDMAVARFAPFDGVFKSGFETPSY